MLKPEIVYTGKRYLRWNIYLCSVNIYFSMCVLSKAMLLSAGKYPKRFLIDLNYAL